MGEITDPRKVIRLDIDDLVEVELQEDDDFLKIRETLTRIGVASKKEKTLFQSCHILHKRVDTILCISKNYSLLMASQQT